MRSTEPFELVLRPGLDELVHGVAHRDPALAQLHAVVQPVAFGQPRVDLHEALAHVGLHLQLAVEGQAQEDPEVVEAVLELEAGVLDGGAAVGPRQPRLEQLLPGGDAGLHLGADDLQALLGVAQLLHGDGQVALHVVEVEEPARHLALDLQLLHGELEEGVLQGQLQAPEGEARAVVGEQGLVVAQEEGVAVRAPRPGAGEGAGGVAPVEGLHQAQGAVGGLDRLPDPEARAGVGLLLGVVPGDQLVEGPVAGVLEGRHREAEPRLEPRPLRLQLAAADLEGVARLGQGRTAVAGDAQRVGEVQHLGRRRGRGPEDQRQHESLALHQLSFSCAAAVHRRAHLTASATTVRRGPRSVSSTWAGPAARG